MDSKDADKYDIERYAGTSSRCAQQVLESEAALRHWPICAADISKAFLQGVTYEELSRLTGEPLREVNFYLPAYNIAHLRTLPGFEDFDPQAEVLHCDKPGTGSVGAPRAFSMKLAGVLKHIGMTSSAVDPELWYRHKNGSLQMVMSKDVDDLKATGPRVIVTKVFAEIQRTFGGMKIN